MNTTALAITGDCSAGFSKSSANKRMAPARKKILLIDDQSDTSLFIALQQEGYEVIACRVAAKGLECGLDVATSLHRYPSHQPESRRYFHTSRDAASWPGGFLSSLQRPSLETMSLIKLWRKWPRFFSLFH